MAKSKTKAIGDYKREKITLYDDPVLVRRFPSGGFVVRDESGEQGDAYDAHSFFLGFGSLAACERAAQTGRVIDLRVSETAPLEDWPFWNAAVAAGTDVLEDKSGRQLIRTHSGVFLRVQDDTNGWTTEWLDETAIEEQYYNDDDECFDLTLCRKPFRLE